jgi:hypothetical protein
MKELLKRNEGKLIFQNLVNSRYLYFFTKRTLEDGIRQGAGSIAAEKRFVSEIEKTKAKKRQLE